MVSNCAAVSTALSAALGKGGGGDSRWCSGSVMHRWWRAQVAGVLREGDGSFHGPHGGAGRAGGVDAAGVDAAGVDAAWAWTRRAWTRRGATPWAWPPHGGSTPCA
ncbi:hypothetical protein GCM10010271_21470 [Streptomyces kurssanovii]|nr:hypothetical protein GCM10010271_21470 [Streptomyces kurssanovii]